MAEHVPDGCLGPPSPDQLTTLIAEVGNCSPGSVLLRPLGEGHHTTNYLCSGGNLEGYPPEFVVRHHKVDDGQTIEMEYDRLNFLDGRRAPRALYCGRPASLGTSVMFVEFVEGTHRDFNELTPLEVEKFAQAVGDIHNVTSSCFSNISGVAPICSGTYGDYLEAMVTESVIDRLRPIDLEPYAPAEQAIDTGLHKLRRMLIAQSNIFAGGKFSLLHHDLNPENVLWNDEVIFIDWNVTFGDPADDLDYIFTNNGCSQAFKDAFLAAYCPVVGCGDVFARIDAYTLKNRLDDMAWTIAMREQYKDDPLYKDAYHQRLAALQASF